MKQLYRTIFIIICAFFCFQKISAQAISRSDQLKKRLVDTICLSMAKADSNSVNTMADAQRVISKCFTDGVMDLYSDYIESTGLVMSKLSEEKMAEITNYIASEVHNNCPIMQLLINRANRMQK